MATRDRYDWPEDAGDGEQPSDLESPAAAPDGGGQSEERDLEAALERARSEAAEHYDRLLRAQAELQNVLKRHERERTERAKYAAEPLARDLLSVVDDLERALQHTGDQSGGLAEGVELVHKGLLNLLARHGVERIEARGKPFDPTEHEAVAMVETDDVPESTVVEEHRAGYRLRDRLLRPAMVAVAKRATRN